MHPDHFGLDLDVRKALQRYSMNLPPTCARPRQDWLLVIYTVSQIDAVVTYPGHSTLVTFCKYWHSGLLVSFFSTCTRDALYTSYGTLFTVLCRHEESTAQ